jgi:hypothetical protein
VGDGTAIEKTYGMGLYAGRFIDDPIIQVVFYDRNTQIWVSRSQLRQVPLQWRRIERRFRRINTLPFYESLARRVQH